jgi:ferredoxin-type protein NapH
LVKLRTARFITASIVILVILLGAVARLGCGTLCSLDAGVISFTCPLGFLQMALASKKLLPQLWLSVALVVLSIVILGRFFCAWICPSALLQGLFGRKRGLNSRRPKRQGKVTASMKLHASAASNPSGPLQPAQTGRPWASYSRYAVLGGALLSSFLFGFPVFCLVCPVGLFFGSLFAVHRLFVAQQPTLELLLFPALLGLELFALKSSWCRSICPLGALLGIIGNFRVLRPIVKKDLCLASRGVNCRACQRVCPEEIDLLSDSDGFSLKDCTTCLECYERCPSKAIKLGL